VRRQIYDHHAGELLVSAADIVETGDPIISFLIAARPCACPWCCGTRSTPARLLAHPVAQHSIRPVDDRWHCHVPTCGCSRERFLDAPTSDVVTVVEMRFFAVDATLTPHSIAHHQRPAPT
jgi:hypothetical protein